MKAVLKKIIPYLLVATLASAATWFAAEKLPNSKLERLADVIDRRFVGQAQQEAIQDAAAEAMIAALGDKWSYYISAQEYAAHRQRQQNAYVGIGVTIQLRADGKGIDVLAVTEGGPAEEAGLLPGDILTHADGTSLEGMNMTQVRSLVMGEKNTKVELTVLRSEEILQIPVTRRVMHSKAAEGMMLSHEVGYIIIDNFHNGAGEESIAQVERLLEEGATKLIFDVRDNPGGYVDEMVEILDYLLPEGPLFRSRSAAGTETVEESDGECLELPMAVLINGNTYSAAEFFAAALSEYEWAVTVGLPTSGKGYYQTTIELGDGSAVQLSIGEYTTPNGVNLTEVGGLQPDIAIEPGTAIAAPEDDPQLMAAIKALIE